MVARVARHFLIASIAAYIAAASAAYGITSVPKTPEKATYLALKQLVPVRSDRTLRWTDIVTSPSGAVIDPRLKTKAKLPEPLDATAKKMVCWDAYSIRKALQNQLDIRTKVVGTQACIVAFNRFISFKNIKISLERYLQKNLLLPDNYKSLTVHGSTGIGGHVRLTSTPGKKFVPVNGAATTKQLQEFISADGVLLPADPNLLRWSSGKSRAGANTVYLEIIDPNQQVLGRLQLNADVNVNKEIPTAIFPKTLNRLDTDRVLVTRGQRVAIQYKLRSIKIDLYGKALNQGKFGDEIIIEPDINSIEGVPNRLKAKVIGKARVLVRP